MLVSTMIAQDFTTRFERSGGAETVTYQEGIDYFQKLCDDRPQLKMAEIGMSDAGKPIHLIVFSTDGIFDAASAKKAGKTVLFINNAIHPGEPDGVDACMLLLRGLTEPGANKARLKDLVIIVVPFYNIGGALNRNSATRVNQNGPSEYGFRGNAKQLDLNRDFIKADTKNTFVFYEIFRTWSPDVFVDTHVSNGADYQYNMTYIATQHNKMGGVLGNYLNEVMVPALKEGMKKEGNEMVPYVNVWGVTPDKEGYEGFLDAPRFASGYAALHNTLSFISETHMLKPYKQRVEATVDFLAQVISFSEKEGEKIQKMRAEAFEAAQSQKDFPLQWELDKSKPQKIEFKGYEGKYKKSAVSGLDRLYYDRNAPFTKQIDFLDTFIPKNFVEKPKAYLIPQAWEKVAEILAKNGVVCQRLQKDSVIEVWSYYVDAFETSKNPYEGHYPHHSPKMRKVKQKIRFFAGDYLIKTDQPLNRLIVETLEPAGPDSFFSWNFFDAALQNKEGFSPYAFEDLAEEILKKRPDIKAALEEKQKSDELFAQDAYAQLFFIYKRSEHWPEMTDRYPVFRVE